MLEKATETAEMITGGTSDTTTVLTGIILVFLLLWFIYDKVYPEIKAGFKGKFEEEEAVSDTAEDMKDVKNKLKRDNKRLEDLETFQKDSACKMELVLGALRLLIETDKAIINGLQQLGANGPTHEADDNLNKFLTNNFGK